VAMADVARPRTLLESREPMLEDLRDLCRALNDRGALYVVIGGLRSARQATSGKRPCATGTRRGAKIPPQHSLL
jgi:hypothetical protein